MLIAVGSASEFEYHLLLAYDLGFLEEDNHRQLFGKTTEVKRMLSRFVNKLRQ
jgi:four helix bundle protein